MSSRASTQAELDARCKWLQSNHDAIFTALQTHYCLDKEPYRQQVQLQCPKKSWDHPVATCMRRKAMNIIHTKVCAFNAMKLDEHLQKLDQIPEMKDFFKRENIAKRIKAKQKWADSVTEWRKCEQSHVDVSPPSDEDHDTLIRNTNYEIMLLGLILILILGITLSVTNVNM